MRSGHLEVQLVPETGHMAETPTGHVVALAGQVYKIKITNHGPRRSLVQVKLDGRLVTEQGLVLNAWQTIFLERPIHATERGRFTVFAEGQTEVFGEDGGRDNPDLGVIEVTHQLEQVPVATLEPYWVRPCWPYRRTYPTFPSPWDYYGPYNGGVLYDSQEIIGNNKGFAGSVLRASQDQAQVSWTNTSTLNAPQNVAEAKAAGTGLTGRSDQNFTPTTIGALESAVTTILLRLILEASSDWSRPRPLPGSSLSPARPPARA